MSGVAVCAASNIALPVLSRLHFQSLHADLVSRYSTALPERGLWFGHDALDITDLSFCNVSLTYTHEGHTEPINTHVYLPLTDNWNGRMVGIGGGGWAAGLFDVSKQQMAGAVSEGYVAVATDAGGDPWNPDPANWALHDDGSANMYLLENFARRALGDTAKIGKAIAENFYGTPPKYSYWNGCSQGGRQGLMLAQRYPDAYDGILAQAPALNLPSLIVSNFWGLHLMNQLGEYPHKCEFEALREAVIADCDHEDGVTDGIISDPSVCLSHFDPFELVGKQVSCPTPKRKRKISKAAAYLAKSAWTGPKMHHGVPLWYGHSPEANIFGINGKVETECKGDSCYAARREDQAISFINNFVRKGINLTTMGSMGYDIIFNDAKTQYDPILATNNPDLSKFRDHGGKMITVHGTADEKIPPEGTKSYYDSVLARDLSAHDYYRYFEAPGVGHCFGGIGPIPTTAFADLVAWVEQGKVPETLLAKSSPNAKGEVIERPLCSYPLVARYRGTGNPNFPQNFYCAEDYLSAVPIKLVIARAKKMLGVKPKVEDELYRNSET